MTQNEPDSALKPYRVLDLTDEKGFFCGRILGDLGMDVLKIEKPDGETQKYFAKYYQANPKHRKLLYYLAYNINKRGITLDIENDEGKRIFLNLVKKSDFLVESFSPMYMGNLGLDYETLKQLNPKLIFVSITPFGQTGPHKDHKASDLTLMARGGLMFLTGDNDRPPIRITVPQAYLHGGVQAASGAMVALYHREQTNEGQHVDISIQQALVMSTLNSPAFWFLNQSIVHRAGPFREGGRLNIKQRVTWPCKDGYIATHIVGGKLGAAVNKKLADWMESEGMSNAFLRNINWENLDMAKITSDFQTAIDEPIAQFFKSHTKKELYEGALQRKIWLYPVQDCQEVINSPQLAARNYWIEVDHPELGNKIMYPRFPVQATENQYPIRCKAPYPGEHNSDIYEQELGINKKELTTLQQKSVI